MEYPELNNEKTIKDMTVRLSVLIKEAQLLEQLIDESGIFYAPNLKFSQKISNNTIAI